MDEIHVVRHKHHTEGHSIRKIALDMGLNRRTVAKYLRESPPVRHEVEDRALPVMGEVGPRIDTLLDEWSGRLPGKHRLTSTRVHRALLDEGYEVGERTVRLYLSEKRRAGKEVYIPLVHRAGDEGQVDFFEVTVDEGGTRRKVWKFLMRSMYSGRDFIRLYDWCDQPCFFEGHVRAFEHFGGVFRRIVYDNLSAAVKRLAGLKDRELTDRFKSLSSHYLFEPCFARPGQGHDKGGVESRGKAIRLQHLTPVVSGCDLEAISNATQADVDRLWSARKHSDGRLLSGLHEEERSRLLPLPERAFEFRRMVAAAVSSSATVKLGGAVYSVPERWARLDAEAWIGCRDVRFSCRGEEKFTARLRPGGKRIEYRDYLGELSRKPQAVRQVAPVLMEELGEPYRGLWTLLEKAHGGRQAGRLMAGVLGAVHAHGEEAVGGALSQALAAEPVAQGVIDEFLSLAGQSAPPLALMEADVPAALRAVRIESGCAADYDELLASGGER
jgi:transposase